MTKLVFDHIELRYILKSFLQHESNKELKQTLVSFSHPVLITKIKLNRKKLMSHQQRQRENVQLCDLPRPYTEGGGAAGAVAPPPEKIKLAIFILL